MKKDPGFKLLVFGISDSEADDWIFMFAAHGNVPFVLRIHDDVREDGNEKE